MYSARGNAVLPALGFPIRESAGHRLFSTSPRLIAAVHALLRLLVPRHPPCALLILTVIVPCAAGVTEQPVAARQRSQPARTGDSFVVWPTLCGFQGPGRARPRGTPGAGLSKLNSTCRARERARFRYRLGRHV